MFRVTLDQFEGPLDLLLFFVRRDELDIQDIPIGRIADEYLETVRSLDALARDGRPGGDGLDLDAAADFIYTAALLIQIKTRMLMPRAETGEDGEPIDPRAELVERLLEYVRFKEAAETLGGRFEARQRLFHRRQNERERFAETAETTFRVTLFDLMQALGTALARSTPAEPERHAVEREAFALDVQRAFVLARLASGASSFTRLIAGEGRAFVITTFLAVLDLAQRQLIHLVFGASPEDFALELAPPDLADPVHA